MRVKFDLSTTSGCSFSFSCKNVLRRYGTTKLLIAAESMDQVLPKYLTNNHAKGKGLCEFLCSLCIDSIHDKLFNLFKLTHTQNLPVISFYRLIVIWDEEPTVSKWMIYTEIKMSTSEEKSISIASAKRIPAESFLALGPSDHGWPEDVVKLHTVFWRHLCYFV